MRKLIPLFILLLISCSPERRDGSVLGRELPPPLPREKDVVLTAADVHPQAAGAWTYRIVEDADGGDSPRSLLRRERSPADAHDAQWITRETFPASPDGEGVLERTQYTHLTPESHVALTAAVSHQDHAISLFDPPLIVAFAAMRPGETRTSGSRIRIVDERDPQRQRERGEARQVVEHLGLETIETPAGTFQAHRLRITFTADLKLAKVRNESILSIAPGLGVIAEERRETVTIMELFPKESKRAMELVEVPVF